jgi:2,5-dioxopentanoate dehydrogenase
MHGKNRIGFNLIASKGASMKAYSPLSGEYLQGDFLSATTEDIDTTLQKATEAFKVYGQMSGEKKALFLEAIAEEILALGDALIQRAVSESALPEGRITGERGRTVGQLRLFASLLREGSWVDASIDTAIPDRQPLPKSDIRKMNVPVGPVVVFTASNFPLAFSTAGGDTASALASGCPVIVKAHESHLGTNEMVADAIAKAAQKTGMPDGVFSSLAGSGYELGQILVAHPKTKSVVFTGSYNGGMALYKLANQREEPIPVFAEMGSINPVFFLPEKLEQSAENLAKTYAGSITMGVGQFCTNPGLLIGIKSSALSLFAQTLGAEIEKIAPGNMLNPGMASAYEKNTKKALEQPGVTTIQANDVTSGSGKGAPIVATVSASDFIKNPNLAHEIFGPYSLLVVCENAEEMMHVTESLAGQLTTTFMSTTADIKAFEQLIHAAKEKCGRLIFNSVPTGVEVCYSMNHGGPFPATTDSRFTSVGTDAIKRFVRPLCFQDAPETFLPDALKNKNTLNIWRNVNGQLSNESIQ